MSLQPDDTSPNGHAARPRGWLRAVIVAPLALVFVAAAVGFIGFLSQLRGVETDPPHNADGDRGADRRLVAGVGRDGTAGRMATASGC